MAQRKPYNPNTPYGRRKMREEHEKWKQSLPPEEREKLEDDNKFWSFIILIIIVIIVLVIGFATGNEKGAMKWLTR